jgi:hypothetical protein
MRCQGPRTAVPRASRSDGIAAPWRRRSSSTRGRRPRPIPSTSCGWNRQPGPPALGHAGDPRALLALVEALYGRRPPAWWITVPATSFEFGEGLSPATARRIAEALAAIERVIGPGGA